MKKWLLFAVLFSPYAMAESIQGSLDLRPSWISSQGSLHSENELGLKVRTTSNSSVGYVQELKTNLYNPGETQGLDPKLSDGYFKGEIIDFYKPTRFTSFTYEPRIYVPVSSQDRKAGVILGTRQYVKWSYQATPIIKINLWEAPILFVHSQNGYEGDDGPVANRVFENRFEAGPEFSFFNAKLNVKFPLILQNCRHRTFQDDARNNGAWTHSLWIYPEVTVPVSGSSTLGLGYYSENLIREDMGAFTLRHGFEKGTVQFIFQQSI